jgi:hypothetical protein
MLRRRFNTLVFAGTLGLLATDVSAQNKPVTCEVMVLHATQQPGAGSIDPSIGNMPQLTKPPFSAYNTYKLLGKASLPLEKGKAQTHTLPNNRVLQVTLSDITNDKRYKVAAAINQPNGKDFLRLLEVTAAPNETFFVAGQSYQNGILVIGMRIVP